MVDNSTMVAKAFNDTDDASMLGHCVHHLIERTAEQKPTRTALICGQTELTYRELNARSNRLSRVLVDRGVRPGSIVAIALDRSVCLVVALLAALKTGAAYVPIDPTFPTIRIAQMLDDATPSAVITNTSLNDTIPGWGEKCLNVDEVFTNDSGDETDLGNIDIDVSPEDLAYLMYTSGSTGKPKGVEMPHGSLSNLLLSLQQDPGCCEEDRMLAVTTISFDMAFLELFLPLLCGATVVIAQAHEVRDPGALVSLMERHEINMMQGTPVAWQMLLDWGWKGQPRLRKMLSSGEALSRQLADRLLECGDALWNLYGPTETTYASCWRVPKEERIVIGRPVANDRFYVLDDDMKPVPDGASGELYIGGATLARGYRNNRELTEEKFLKNPLHEGLFYRTGDLASFIEPGKLAVLGRIGSIVKVRGYRIEPGDVEAAITDHWYVSGAVVISRDDRLIAYCVRDSGVPVDKEVSGNVLTGLLRPWLTERLPAYMVPALFVELESLPLTLNGKIDRKGLPDPVTVNKEPASANSAGTKLEQEILAIWTQVLGHNSISMKDNFFQIGGDSMRVIRVQKELQKLLRRPVSTAKLFEHFTIKAQAAYLSSADDSTVEAVPVHQNTANNEDIAIVSTACRLPGGVATPEDFWKLLEDGRDAIVEVPKDRWNVDEIYDPDPTAQGKSYCRHGGFISSIDKFDAGFFGISPREARSLDPSQSMVLETCWEGLERAGYSLEQLRGSRTGVFIGTSNVPAHYRLDPGASQNVGNLDGYTTTGTAGGTISGRVSYVLGLEGPAMTIDTACSSSLVTTHLACAALRRGECDMAVSAGVSLMLNPGLHIEFSRLRGISPDGRCRAFAADTPGTGWGEGSAVVVLKRLSDAKRDGDLIHAVLKGTAVNHDGRSAGLTIPSGLAQQKLIRTALADAHLQPDAIDYIEAHGTGTKLGDPIEATALADVFGAGRPGKAPLFLGSAKSNIGHTQAAAGLVGLLKVVLAMKHNTLPQTLHASQPTLAVDWETANMALVQKNQPWQPCQDRPRRAGISAFGIGGTNAHVIVEEPPRQINAHQDGTGPAQSPHKVPFLLSATTEAALVQQATKLHEFISSTDASHEGIADIAYSLAATRTHFPHRMALVADGRAEILDKLSAVTDAAASTSSTDPVLAMLFTGQGSQRLGMGKGLYSTYPVFRDAIDAIATRFTQLESSLLDVMWADPGTPAASLLNRTDFAQPALFALEVGLWRLWQSWGVTPDFVLGHSVGELAAAHAAGILNLDDACRLVEARGRLMQALPENGGMVSLQASEAECEAAIESLGLGDEVDIAGVNTPTQTVVSGHLDAMERLTAHMADQGRKSKKLEVSHAFHSRYMEGMLADFQAVAETVSFNAPKIAVVSSLTGTLATEGQLEQPSYWVQQVRRAVRFSDGIRALANNSANVFLELGPRPVLCGMGAMCLADEAETFSAAWLPSLAPNKDETLAVQTSLAELHVKHVAIDWPAYFQPFGCSRVELPTYAFQRERYRATTQQHKYSNDSAVASGANEVAQDGLDSLRFEVSWKQADAAKSQLAGSWGVLCPAGDVAWAETVKTALPAAGIQLVPVADLEDAQTLDGLICLWDSEADPVRQAHHFITTALGQLQAAASTGFAPPLVWVTRYAVGTGAGDGPDGLGAAPLWGLMRTARSEHPELRLRLVDLGDAPETAAISAALVMSAEPECAVRQSRVLVPRLTRVGFNVATEKPMLRSDGAVLITGGLGDLGSRVARWLVSVHGIRDIVLTSRRGADSPTADPIMIELGKLGANTTIVAGDVADADSAKSILAMFNEDRPLRGVIHAAGVVDSGILATLTPQMCATTLGPKVDGAWNLHELTQQMDLDVFMMFSSISGVMGMPGLANYAAANTFLDAIAHHRRANGLPATAVAYGTWGGDGMAAHLAGATRAHLDDFGLGLLEPDYGLKLLEQSVRSGRALTMAAALDTERHRGYLQDRGGVTPFLQTLLGQSTKAASRGMSMQDALVRSRPAEHSDIVLRMVRETVAKALGFAKPEDVDSNKPLQDLGIDSLTAVLMRNHLSSLTGLKLPANIAMLHPNLKALSQFLLVQVQESCSASSSSSSVGDDTPSSGSSATSLDLNMPAVRKGCLDPSFTFKNVTQGPTKSAPRPTSAFVTGATGFVGAFVVHDLLKLGISVHCLVRASSTEHARKRMLETLESYNLWKPEFEPLLNAVTGDLSQPLLGMTEDEFYDIADRVDTILHSGALVDWLRPLEDYIGPNVVSTHEVLRLASSGRAKAVHLISTVSALPKYMGYDFTEEDREYGYGTSKYMAERMVAAARWRGAHASVYRLPFVTASATNGQFRSDRGDFLHNLITGSLELGAFPQLDGNLAAVLPVDYLSNTITTIMTKDLHRIGQDYDFINTTAPTFNEFFGLIGKARPGKEIVPFSIWQQRAMDYAADHPKGPLARITAVFDGYTNETAAAMITALPAGAHVFGGDDFPVPAVDDESVRKYLDCIDAANM